MDEISSQFHLSTEPSTLGFELSSGNVWIYPENYPVREYQFNIVNNALFRNTLVCLPTGLGKTFIAAVVMYNFWRWYPKGKVVFLAPTKPLVAQQINACYEIMGIPSEETVELTGTTNQKQRETAWAQKRVIFSTPQTFHKDLEKNIFPMNSVKCLVIDEAHKALGKHSYCESIRLLTEQNKYFRVLALSATPGDKISKVHEVISNLHISNLELRDDMSPDIAPYINERKLDIILVRLSDELAKFKEQYIAIMDPHVRLLVRLNILKGDTGNISKGRIFHLTKEFQSKPNKSGNYGQIMKTLNILLTMYHAYELMVRHGLRAFIHFYESHSDKFWMENESNLHDLLENIKNYLGPFPIIEPLPDGSVPDVPNDLIFGHNKFYKLKELLERHFKSYRDKNQETRAIVFVEYRDIVNEVYVLLLQSRPLIRPQMFVGQAGQKQKQQIRALQDFRSNKVNILISTSVGEEGLDVGEVDLIVCFDTSQSSPIRLVQRMGRTGRQRDGHIIALVTDGKEHQSLQATICRKDNLNNKVLQSSDIVSALYEKSPRMVPNQFNPECRKIGFMIQPKVHQVKGTKKRKVIEKKKKENTGSNIFEREIGTKPGGQSSMDNFLKVMKLDETNSNDKFLFASQTQQAIKPENIKLLLSDKENVEFLTLCAMRNSQNNFHFLDTAINSRYIPSCRAKGLEIISNFTLPDLRILDCIPLLEKMEITKQKIENQDTSIFQHEEIFDCFEKGIEFSKTHLETSEVTIGRSFADLIYDSSSSEEVLEKIDNKSNKFEITGQFDDLLNESTDESEMEEISGSQNQDPCKEASTNSQIRENEYNFSRLLEDSSCESNTEQMSPSSVILENKPAVTEENIFKQQNISRDHSFTSFKSNCSGVTITQLIEEVGRINANKLVKNNSLIKEQSNDVIEVIKDNSLHFPTEIKKKVSSTSDVQKGDTQKNHLLFQIPDSDDDLFDIEIEELSIVNDKNILNSKEPENDGPLSKHLPDEVLPNNDSQIIKIKPTKNESISDKENLNLALNVINDDDWESDFEIPTNAINDSKYFKKDEGLKTAKKNESFETSWISCAKTSNNANKKNTMPSDNSSLFKSNKSSTSDKIDSFNNCDKRFEIQKNDDDNCIQIFKRPTIRPPSKFSLNNTHKTVQLLTNDKCKEYRVPPIGESTSISNIENRKTKKNNYVNSRVEENSRQRKGRKKNRRNCDFLDNEADVSFDGEDTSEGTSGEDDDLEGFVSYTQNIHDEVDMHTHYLNSVKSPVRRPGAFLIKRTTHIEENVFSQPISQEDNSYLYDSFCVKEDEIEYNDETDDDLEVTYVKLSEKSLERERKRKREKSPSYQIKKRKRRKGRIVSLNNDSSSEDETEKIRRQILEESFLLKGNKS